MTGKKPRPSTEPMYSGGSIKDYLITPGYDSVEYTDFVSNFITNSENILICQSICYGDFYGCFAPSRRYIPTPSTSWAIRNNYYSFLEFVNEKWKWINGKSQQIYSLACDENKGFGVFLMENYGTAQSIITNTSDIKKMYDVGFRITACAARGSTFYVIMTKDTKEYKRKAQACFIRSTWNDACTEINAEFSGGKHVTGLCYSTGLKLYFVVMTEKADGQYLYWFNDGNARNNWMDEKWKEGFHPTIIFRDPNLNKTLVVMTADKNRSGFGYDCRFGYKLK